MCHVISVLFSGRECVTFYFFCEGGYSIPRSVLTLPVVGLCRSGNNKDYAFHCLMSILFVVGNVRGVALPSYINIGIKFA
jgi:hypothetical protein